VTDVIVTTFLFEADLKNVLCGLIALAVRASGGSIGGDGGDRPPYGVEIIIFIVVFLQK